MKASDIFQKTASGLSEIGNLSDALTVKQRRVLILVNGKNDTSTLRKLSLCNDIVEILDTLLHQGFIDRDKDGPAHDYTLGTGSPPAAETGARELMSNTLLIFANRARVGKLIKKINAAKDIDSLKELVNPWHQAMAETPGGMRQADELKQEVLQMIQDEEFNGLL
jgi:hypothetical protein